MWVYFVHVGITVQIFMVNRAAVEHGNVNMFCRENIHIFAKINNWNVIK